MVTKFACSLIVILFKNMNRTFFFYTKGIEQLILILLVVSLLSCKGRIAAAGTVIRRFFFLVKLRDP